MSEFILKLENITKIYPNGFVANEKINLSIRKGTIHALAGENGAGKSTLMKVLFGIETHEEGTIIYQDEPVDIKSPSHAIELGIGMVHQHFMLVPSMTVAENLIIGIEETNHLGFIEMDKVNQLVSDFAQKFNFRINPKQRIRDLSVGQKQKVEIIKALIRGAKLLILDEPTAVLTPQETDELFVQLKKMREEGYTIVFISHKLDEIIRLCDDFTVIRRGKTIQSGTVAGITEQDISRMMVGRDVILNVVKEEAEPKEVVLNVKNLSMYNLLGKKVVDELSFSLRAGEILGIAGVEGNGQTELSEIITGMASASSGEIYINNFPTLGKSVRTIRETGLAHISEDRMTYGCVETKSVWQNIMSDRYYHKRFSGLLSLKFKNIFSFAEDSRNRFNIKCDSVFDNVKMLSGGNIQKVIVAREFTSEGNLIIANQPTRGIDVGATEFIRKELVRMTREENKAVLLISADLNEVMELSDSLLVMVDGKFVAYFKDTKAMDEYELGKFMLGLERMPDDQIRSVYVEK